MSEKKQLRSWLPKDQEVIEEMLRDNPVVEADLSDLLATVDKTVKSLKVNHNGVWFWKAYADKKGDVWVTNVKDPRIINTVTGKMRGNLSWAGEGGNPAGKPQGAVNRKTAKSVCDALGVHPMELIAAYMSKDRKLLRKYGIYEKEYKTITAAQQLKSAMYLGDKLQANLKPAEMGLDGEARLADGVAEEQERSQIQAYIPDMVDDSPTLSLSKEDYAEIQEVGAEAYMKSHEKELEPYDESNEDDKLVWSVNE